MDITDLNLTRRQWRQFITPAPVVEETDPWASDPDVAKHDAHNRWAA